MSDKDIICDGDTPFFEVSSSRAAAGARVPRPVFMKEESPDLEVLECARNMFDLNALESEGIAFDSFCSESETARLKDASEYNCVSAIWGSCTIGSESHLDTGNDTDSVLYEPSKHDGLESDRDPSFRSIGDNLERSCAELSDCSFTSLPEDVTEHTKPHELLVQFEKKKKEDCLIAKVSPNNTVLGSAYKSHGHTLFQPEVNDVGTVLMELGREGVLDVYATTVPHCFQGQGCFAVRLYADQMNRAMAVCRAEGNGHWKLRNRRWVYCKEGGFVFVYREWFNDFGLVLKISYVVDSTTSERCDGSFALMQYRWMPGRQPQQFPVGKERTPKYIINNMKATLSPVADMGKPKTPRFAYQVAMNAISASDLLVNPTLRPSGERQAKNARRAVYEEEFGCDKFTHLRNHSNVTPLDFECGGKKMVNYMLSVPYLLNFIATLAAMPATNMEGIFYLDTTFNLTNAYAVVLVFVLYGLQNRERKTPYIVVGPIMLTQSKSAESYEVFPLFLKKMLPNIFNGSNVIRLITDSETALFGGWEKWLGAIHTHCVVHLRKNVKHAAVSAGLDQPSLKAALSGIFGLVNDNTNHHQLGLIDAPNVTRYARALAKLEEAVPHPNFWTQFKRANGYSSKIITKLIGSVRQNMGFLDNLPHTNFCEAINKKLKALFGTHQDIRVFADNVFKLYEQSKNEIFESLLERGNYRLVDPKQPRIGLEDLHNQSHIKLAVETLFHGSPGPISTYPSYMPDKDEIVVPVAIPMPFSETGLPDACKRSWIAGLAIQAKIPTSVFPRPLTSLTSSITDVCSDKDSSKRYRVVIHRETGESQCSCDDYRHHAKHHICKHIVAASVATGLTMVIVARRMQFKDYATVSGHKSSKAYKRIGGTGSTKRTNRELDDPMGMLDDSDPDLREDHATTSAGSGNKKRKPTTQVYGPVSKRGKKHERAANEGMPWNDKDNKEKFVIRQKTALNPKIKCMGCKLLFANNPPHLDLLMTRTEKDRKWQDGADTAAEMKHYCLSVECAQKRHRLFDPTTDTATAMILERGMSVEQKALIDKFQKGQLY